MKLPIFQVDAFTDKVFSGNPAAVCPLEDWLDDKTMQKIAQENAVAETAFVCAKDEGFEIRWFTPEIEMDLCGHATLAAAHVLVEQFEIDEEVLHFESRSGALRVRVTGSQYQLDFPSRPPAPCEVPQSILEAFSIQPVETLKARDYVLVYPKQSQIKKLKIDRALFDRNNLDPGGVIITAPGKKVDFVSRFFVPQASITEDPVTGSAHCSLIPYWAGKLNKFELTAKQLSERKGELDCQLAGDRVLIAGQAVTYLMGTIDI